MSTIYSKAARDMSLHRVGDLFVKATFYDPLVKNLDVLANRHANTCVLNRPFANQT